MGVESTAITTPVWLLYQLSYQALESKVVGSYIVGIFIQVFFIRQGFPTGTPGDDMPYEQKICSKPCTECSKWAAVQSYCLDIIFNKANFYALHVIW